MIKRLQRQVFQPQVDRLDSRLLLSSAATLSPSALNYCPTPIVEDVSTVTMDLSMGFIPQPIPAECCSYI
jgi:hypothetical protein